MGKERSDLELIVKTIDNLTNGLADAESLLDMAVEEDDEWRDLVDLYTTTMQG